MDCFLLSLRMPYAILLLDEGSPITGAIFLLKAIPVVLMYGAAFYFLLHNRRTSESKPVGVMLAIALAAIGIRIWPEDRLYVEYSYSALFAAVLLFLPLLTAAMVYFFARNSPRD
jgi:hypothetical protein